MVRITERVRRHLRNPDSQHRQIALGFVWVSMFVFVGKLASAAKEMAIAWKYGVSETVDAYVFVINLVTLPVAIWFSVLTVVLVPFVARIRNTDPNALPQFRGELLGLTLAVGTGMGCFAYFGLPVLLRTGISGFSGSALTQALAMTGPLTLLLPMGAIVSLFSAWMMANGQHRNTLLEACPAVAILAALLLPPGWVPEPLIWGTVAGVALQISGLAFPLNRAGELQPPILGFQSSAWKGFWGSFGIMAAGQALMSVTGILDQFFAAHLNTGAISTLSYANRIVSLIVSLGATAISRATLPIFSKLAGDDKTDEVRVITRHWAKLMLILGCAVMGITWWLAPWLVKLLFERGAFKTENTVAVIELVRYLSLQLPFLFPGILLGVNLTSRKQYSHISFVASIGFLVKLTSNIILIPMFGVIGIALSTLILYLVIFLLLIYFI